MPFQISKTPGRWAVYCPGDGFDYCSGITLNDVVITWEIDGPDDELLGIKLEPKPGGLISTIDTRPNGTVNPIPGSTTAVIWDAGDSRWETAATYTLTGGTFYTFTVTPAVTLTTGDSCNPTFSAVFQYIDLGSVPTASPTISGTRQVGFTLTGSDGYSDPDGDAQDTTATIRRWYSYSDAAGTLDETLLGTGSTYTLTSSEVDRYIRYKVIPYAVAGPSPGPEGQSAVFGGIAPSTLIMTFPTTRNGLQQFTIDTSTLTTVATEWGDGTLEIEDVNGTDIIDHTYASGVSKDVEFYAVAANLTQIDVSSCDIDGILDITGATAIVDLDAESNANLTSITNPILTNMGPYDAKNCGITGTITFPAGTTWNQGALNFLNNGSMTGLDFSGNTGTIALLILQNTDITGTLDLSTLNALSSGGTIYQMQNNSNMTAIDHGSTTGNCSRYWVNASGLTTLTIPFDFLTNSTFRCHNTSSLTTLNLTGTVTTNQFWAYSCDLTGTLDLSNVDTQSGTQVLLYNNTNLTSVNHGSSKTGTIGTYSAFGCALGYYSLGGLSFTSTAIVRLDGNGMTAAEVNEWLVNCDPTGSGEDLFPASGSGSLDISGSNAAPDGTSGGFDGLTAKANLIGAGYTVTTS